MASFLAANNISHLTSPPHTPQHNGISERKHRHIIETGLSLLTHAKMPLSYWPYAFATAIYLINRLPSSPLSFETPYAKLFQTQPNYTKLRTFGSLCFPWLRPYSANKLEKRSLPCVFLGYSLTQSAYLCLDPTSGRIYTSRHVRFNENEFPFPKLSAAPNHSSSSYVPTGMQQSVPLILSRPLMNSPTAIEVESPQLAPSPTREHSAATLSAPSPDITQPCPSPATSHTSQPQQTQPSTSSPPTEVHIDPQPEPSAPPSPVQPAPANQHPMKTRAKNAIIKPNKKFSLSSIATPVTLRGPTTWTQAMKDNKWRGSMTSEFNSQVRNRTWDLVPFKPHMNVVGFRWVYTLKFLADGTLDRRKSRLVAKGYHQQHGLDFTDTFSPVIKPATIRTVLGIAVNRDWPVRQLDVNNAFLQGNLTEEVYMCQPPGFVDPDKPNHVCRLRKAIYGLKQAPRAWYVELRNYLLSAGFVNSQCDASLFIYKRNSDWVYLLVYVDDMLVTGTNQVLVQHIIDSLANRFSIKDLGQLSYFFGIEATRTDFI